MFPPSRAKLVTSPAATGSPPAAPMTIGIPAVACFAPSAAVPCPAKMYQDYHFSSARATSSDLWPTYWAFLLFQRNSSWVFFAFDVAQIAQSLAKPFQRGVVCRLALNQNTDPRALSIS